MNIYVDEAGLFVPPKTGHRYSLVLALVIPTANEEELLYEFLRLRDGWPNKAVEIKGSKLNESQAAEVLSKRPKCTVLPSVHEWVKRTLRQM